MELDLDLAAEAAAMDSRTLVCSTYESLYQGGISGGRFGVVGVAVERRRRGVEVC